MSWLRNPRARLAALVGRDPARGSENPDHTDTTSQHPVASGRWASMGSAPGYGDGSREGRRGGRPLAWLGGLGLDLKLAVRMLVKYPGLTIVGGLAMSFAIWVGAVVFEMVMLFANPTLPLPDGDRLVHIRTWHVAESRTEPRTLEDFVLWRGGLQSVTDLGAYRDLTQNLIVAAGDALPVAVAEITASAFRVASEPPLLGRTLAAADEAAGAPPVVVIGHDVWQSRFAGSPAVIGQGVQLGDTYATIIGVMPDGFAFPVSHDVWTPFRSDVLDDTPGRGPSITVFGRLAPGVSVEEAQAELTTFGRRAALERPDTHEHLQPQVTAYTNLIGGGQSLDDLGILLLIELFALALLVLVCGNVALLLFARAATRESEIVVRSALGASRRRIVMQLFAEALVLGGVAATVGLTAAHLGLRQFGLPFLELNLGQVPFWYDPRLSATTVLYAVTLTVLGAVIAGVMPGLKITRGLGSRLRAGTAGGGGVKFGGVWTAVIVAQVAVTVAFPAVVLLEVKELERIRSYDLGFAAEEYLAVAASADLGYEAGPDADSTAVSARLARFGASLETLRHRLAAEPGVSGVTFVNQLPRDNYGDYDVELDDTVAVASSAAAAGGPAAPVALPEVALAFVDPNYFDVLDVPIIAGRGFQAADLVSDSRVAIVDQEFVHQVLQGRNPIGRRVRLPDTSAPPGEAAEPAPWFEIVGLVRDLGMGGAAERGRSAGLYLPGTPGTAFPPYMVIHAQGDPLSLVPRVRAIAAAVDPTLRLSEFQSVDQVTSPLLWMLGLWLRSSLVMTAVALILSLAGIFAVLSFTVSRRTHEIGVRVALGGSRRRVVTAVFRRPLTQVSIGVAAGAVLIGAGAIALLGTEQYAGEEGGFSLGQVALLVAYAALMLGVCLLACVVPTRRALAVEPTEALRVQ